MKYPGRPEVKELAKVTKHASAEAGWQLGSELVLSIPRGCRPLSQGTEGIALRWSVLYSNGWAGCSLLSQLQHT